MKKIVKITIGDIENMVKRVLSEDFNEPLENKQLEKRKGDVLKTKDGVYYFVLYQPDGETPEEIFPVSEIVNKLNNQKNKNQGVRRLDSTNDDTEVEEPLGIAAEGVIKKK